MAIPLPLHPVQCGVSDFMEKLLPTPASPTLIEDIVYQRARCTMCINGDILNMTSAEKTRFLARQEFAASQPD